MKYIQPNFQVSVATRVLKCLNVNGPLERETAKNRHTKLVLERKRHKALGGIRAYSIQVISISMRP